MPNALFKWIHKKRVERRGKPPLPVLPRERPRPLTPSPSDEVPSSATATAKSSFFQRLPTEIRRIILIDAFGDQVVHMDLFYDHPPLPAGEPGPAGAAHCNLNVNLASYRGDPPVKLDYSLPKQWLWRSSVCHRNFMTRSSPHFLNSPARDKCRYGDTEDICSLWPGEVPGKCFIGVMGWLLSCRQAYAEGVDVLYSTNTFHSASREMILAMPRLLLPQRLSSIKSAELLWEFEPHQGEGPTLLHPTPSMESLKTVFGACPSIFRNSKSLYISLQGKVYGHDPIDYESDDWRESNHDALLEPVDDMVKNLGPRVKECTIAVPSLLYMVRRDRAKRAGTVVEHFHLGQDERHWRSVESASLGGYWVTLGARDLRFPFVCTMGGMQGLVPDGDRVMYGG